VSSCLREPRNKEKRKMAREKQDKIKKSWEDANDRYNDLCDAIVLVNRRMWNKVGDKNENVIEYSRLNALADVAYDEIDVLYSKLKASYR
jgi:acyl carrier protein phosphodiesterase